jgi:hypothetical protein
MARAPAGLPAGIRLSDHISVNPDFPDGSASG